MRGPAPASHGIGDAPSHRFHQASRQGQPLPSSLPSAVAPEIESFVKQSGRDLPQSPVPSAPNTSNTPAHAGLARSRCPPRRANGARAGRQRIRRAGSFTTGHPRGPQSRPDRADRPPLPDQPGHRAAAVRRAALDRGRRAGQGLDCRGRIDAGQVALVSRAQHRFRLHPPRRWRTRLQQGHHDRTQRRTSSTAVPACTGFSPRPMPSSSRWWPGRC